MTSSACASSGGGIAHYQALPVCDSISEESRQRDVPQRRQLPSAIGSYRKLSALLDLHLF
jgi:hypothetical protein